MSTLEQVESALSGLTYKDNVTLGTRALVESLRVHSGASFAELARRAKCSVPGINRWRSNDSGATNRVAPLITFAESLVAAGDMPSNTPSLTPSTSHLTVADLMRTLPLRQLEEAFAKALAPIYGSALQKCDIVNLDMADAGVTLTLSLK